MSSGNAFPILTISVPTYDVQTQFFGLGITYDITMHQNLLHVERIELYRLHQYV